ncbi:MAG: hypothetical protein L0Y36_05155 [Planctomycetales bacterium]|nr:hypothetical protein [Planctomycetales bacterium]
MSEQKKHHWAFRTHLVDRAGAVTSIASAFSNEDISIDTLVACKSEKQMQTDGGAIITFYCTEEEKDMMVRKIRRLSKVKELYEHPYESHSLRKSATIKVTRRLFPCDVAGEKTFLTCELVKEDKGVFVYFLAGSPYELDQILKKLGNAGLIKDMVYSVIGL